jgi:predicted small metal-binding protein
MKQLSCRDAGFDCDYLIKAETDEEIFRKGGEHAMMEHKMKQEDLTSEFKERLRGLIRTTE